MKIVDVKAVQIDIPVGAAPSHDAGYVPTTESTAPWGYVEVTTDDGVTGFCPAAAPPSLVEGPIKRAIVGENPLEIERIWTQMWQGWRHPKMDDLMAISKVDIAIWDLAGKLLGQPVWRLLGGARRRVRAYGAGGMYREGKDVAGLVGEMMGFVEDGFRAVKMKVAWIPFAEDVARVRAVREAIGPDVDLMVDANHAWLPHEAIKFGRAVEKYDIYWLEEPVAPWDYRGCAEVARALDIPIATGENVGALPLWRDMIDARACDILNADALYCGGPTEWRRIAALAHAHSLPMAPHGNGHVHAQLVGGVPNGTIVEVGLYQGLRPARPPTVEPLRVVDGFIDLTDEPGFGWRIDREAIKWHMDRFL